MALRWCVPAVILSLVAACGGSGEPAATPTPTSLDGAASSTTTYADRAPAESVDNEPWAAMAATWWDALGEAAYGGSEQLATFLAPDMVFEDRIMEIVTHTADEWLTNFSNPGDLQYVLLPWRQSRLFVSADELLGELRFDMEIPVYFLHRMSVDRTGIRDWTRAASIESWRHVAPDATDVDLADALADRYVELWNGSGDVDAASVYAEDATIEDTLLGTSASGADVVDRSVVTGAWPSVGHLSIDDLADDGGRSVFPVASGSGRGAPPGAIWLVVDVDDGTRCPRSTAVVLELEHDRIIAERRYHEIDSARRCLDPDDLRPGWWEQIETPANVAVERTGTLEYGDLDIAVYNSTPDLERFFAWGLSRYEAAGLALPPVASVTFTQTHTVCSDVGGRSVPTAEGADITLCASAGNVCTDDSCQQWTASARRLLLHELAHPWLDQYTDDATRAEFLDYVGLERWSDHDDEWSQRGVERAANTFAFSLMDEPAELEFDVFGGCTERDDGFRILTGIDPVASCDDTRVG